jgi:predicted sulfurtransferase
VTECDEVVTLGAAARGGRAALDMTATHVSPQHFHDELSRAAGRGEGSEGGEVVLLDARNVYESRIG